MTVYPVQANFSRGEITPFLHSAVDLEYYKSGLERCSNFIVLKYGGLRKRPGFKFVARARDQGKKSRLIPFQFSTEQTYVMEFSDGFIRPFVTAGIVTAGGGAPGNISRSNPAVVTLPGHGFANGNRVYAVDLGGMGALNNREFIVANAAANTFELSGVNSTAFPAFVPFTGTIKKIVEIASPYGSGDLPRIGYAQSNDVLTLAHQRYTPRELIRSSDTSWSMTEPKFIDGPYFDAPANNTNGVTLSATNAIHPKMTSNTTPSGVVASLQGGDESYRVFDWDKPSLAFEAGYALTWISYTPPTSTTCNNYWLKGPVVNVLKAPSAWTFQGWNGTAWVDLDRRDGETSWGAGEVRYFQFMNATAYGAYRLDVTALNGEVDFELTEIAFGYNGDFAPDIDLTFDNVSNINLGGGFNSLDTGRQIRLRGSDGKWRWFRIGSVISNKIVRGKMYGPPLPNLSPIYTWRLGAWFGVINPGKVSFFKSRRVFASSPREPYAAWLTKAFDFFDFGVSQPLVEDDAMNIRLLTGKVTAINWLAELQQLTIGTSGSVRTLTTANKNQGFGATNFDASTLVFSPANDVVPAQVGSVLIYADYYGKSLRELVYDINQDGYIAPDVSVLSEHLFNDTIEEIVYQASPGTVIWVRTAGGKLVCVTYDREQKVVGFAEAEVAGGSGVNPAFVESICAKPGAGRDEIWIIVRTTVNGEGVRYIETLAPEFEEMAVEDGVFLDHAISYYGAPTNTVSGAMHLAGSTVYALAGGFVCRNLTVSADGNVTLPTGMTASPIHIGRQFTALGRTLALNEAGQQDGAGIGRRKLLSTVRTSIMDTLDLKVRGLTSIDAYDVISRNITDPAEEQLALRKGIFECAFDQSWRDDGQFEFFSDDPLPCLIRAFILQATGEP
jgi:hypothetical protein